MMNSVDSPIKVNNKRYRAIEQAFARDISMEELLQRFPELLVAINKYKLHCAGCLLARFHNVSDAAIEHGWDEDELTKELILEVAREYAGHST
jgi:hybrid cluster-associated redox disulfide protein